MEATELLRNLIATSEDGPNIYVESLCRDAASELQRLRSEVDQLEDVNAKLVERVLAVKDGLCPSIGWPFIELGDIAAIRQGDHMSTPELPSRPEHCEAAVTPPTSMTAQERAAVIFRHLDFSYAPPEEDMAYIAEQIRAAETAAAEKARAEEQAALAHMVAVDIREYPFIDDVLKALTNIAERLAIRASGRGSHDAQRSGCTTY